MFRFFRYQTPHNPIASSSQSRSKKFVYSGFLQLFFLYFTLAVFVASGTSLVKALVKFKRQQLPFMAHCAHKRHAILAQFVVHHATDSNRTIRVECLRCHHTCQIFKCRFAVGQLLVYCRPTVGRQHTDRLLGELFFTFTHFATGMFILSNQVWVLGYNLHLNQTLSMNLMAW